MRGLVWIVALAACAKQGGVQISVRTDDPSLADRVTDVRIFVAAGTSTPDGIDIASAKFTTTYWFRDPGVADDTAKVSGHRADFAFTPGPEATRIPLVIAVGFDATGVMVGAGELPSIDVPKGGWLSYDLSLMAVDDAHAGTWDEKSPTTALDRLCVRFDNGTDPVHVIANPYDQDCDGFTDGSSTECDPDTYMSTVTRTAAPDDFTCLTTGSTTQPGIACVAGGPTCMDGQVPTGSCVASGYCVPPKLCAPDACGSSIDCAHDIGPKDLPRFECTIDLMTSSGKAVLCEDPVMLPASNGSGCSGVSLRNEQQNFLPTLSVDSDLHHLTFAATHNDCNITFQPAGSFTVSDPLQKPDLDLVAGLMAVDTGPRQGFLAPVVFRFRSGQSSCNSSCRARGNLSTPDLASVCGPNVSSTWSPPAIAPGFSGGGSNPRRHPTVTAAQDQMFFSECNGNVCKIMRTTTDPNGMWQTPAPLFLSGTGTAPTLSHDEHTLYFVDLGKAMSSTFTTGVGWGVPAMIDNGFDANQFVQGIAMAASGNDAIQAAGMMSPPTGLDLYETRMTANQWTPTTLTTVSSSGSDTSPMLASDVALYFSSTRSGSGAGDDIFVSTRSNTTGPFGLAVSIGNAINTSSNDSDPWILTDPNTDAQTLYFASDRNGGVYQIWVSKKN